MTPYYNSRREFVMKVNDLIAANAAKEDTPMTVKTAHGTHDLDTIAQYMDDDIRESLHSKLSPCADQVFFDAYCEAHLRAHGTVFIWADKAAQV